jgi:hypothetical protein
MPKMHPREQKNIAPISERFMFGQTLVLFCLRFLIFLTANFQIL